MPHLRPSSELLRDPRRELLKHKLPQTTRSAAVLCIDELQFLVLTHEMQNAKCKIEVFPSEMIKISRRRRHLHLSFVICNYELSAHPMQRQTEIRNPQHRKSPREIPWRFDYSSVSSSKPSSRAVSEDPPTSLPSMQAANCSPVMLSCSMRKSTTRCRASAFSDRMDLQWA